MKKMIRTALTMGLSCATIAGVVRPAEARTLRVNNRTDSSAADFCSNSSKACTLRKVFELADANPGEFFTVHLDVKGTYALNPTLTLRRGSLELIGNTNDASSA